MNSLQIAEQLEDTAQVIVKEVVVNYVLQILFCEGDGEQTFLAS